MALALARKYRPKAFGDVAVQSHVAATLKGAIARNRVAHGYLLCGPRGTGKTTLARVLAMALNCDRRGDAELNGEPCGSCASCTRIWSGSSSLDVVEIDAASNRGVDDARELRERAMYAPSGDDRYKVYIIDEAHMLTREAWNALLKILEEPPPRVVFVFATTEPQKIAQMAAPVLSRLQRFDLKRIGSADIRERLQRVLGAEGVTSDPDALAMIARAADGSMRDALSLADQVLSMGDGTVEPSSVRDALGLVPEDEFIALMDILAEHRAGDVFAFVGRLADGGVDFSQFLSGFADMVRAQLAVNLGGAPPDSSERVREALGHRTSNFDTGELLRMLAAVTDLEPKFRKSGQQQLLLEAMLVRFALLDRTISIESVIKGLGGGGGGSVEDPPAPRRVNAPPMTPPPPPRTADTPAPRSAESPPARAAEPVSSRTAEPLSARVISEGSAPVVASPPKSGIPDVSQLAERWDDIVKGLRKAGKNMAATAMTHTSPVAVNGKGEVIIELDDASDIYAQAIDREKAEVVRLLQEIFAGVSRVTVKQNAASAAPQGRLTDDMVRAERLSAMRRKDPVLDRAVDELDLDLAE